MLRTRFAPSPTGLLHLGNAYSALYCEQWAKQQQAQLWLRIEDIDHTRCRPPYIQAIRDDLTWLGMSWQNEAPLQSARLHVYEHVLKELQQQDLIYPCFCTRRDFALHSPSTVESRWQCPQACAQLSSSARQRQMAQKSYAMRLNCAVARHGTASDLAWQDHQQQYHHVWDELNADPIIGRKDIRYSYHLCVVVDDAEQGITHIIRGMDLLPSTAIHRLLQALLSLPSPLYAHHPLLLDNQGQRLAKRVASTALQAMRETGVSAASVRQKLRR
ncbi:MAG: tRNA glutamyl-Q(34) synthetase GluQRS [Mariprofundaceae bacterium]|nr:tRNA glutamyl-Q(34) synthetase GluQRS [Mariprofundaceae bacterium]